MSQTRQRWQQTTITGAAAAFDALEQVSGISVPAQRERVGRQGLDYITHKRTTHTSLAKHLHHNGKGFCCVFCCSTQGCPGIDEDVAVLHVHSWVKQIPFQHLASPGSHEKKAFGGMQAKR